MNNVTGAQGLMGRLTGRSDCQSGMLAQANRVPRADASQAKAAGRRVSRKTAIVNDETNKMLKVMMTNMRNVFYQVCILRNGL